MTKDEALKEAQKALDRMFQIPAFRRLLPQMPRYRYWRFHNYAFCYTTERTSNKKFYALIYRIIKKGKVWKLKKKVAYGKRKVAKKKAYEWFEKQRKKFEQDSKVR
jgi:hypothetical protein